VNPKILRQHARDCGRMANESPDLFTKEALRELAVEFTRAADALESSSRTKLRGHPPQSGSTKPISSSRLRPGLTTVKQAAPGGGRRRSSSAR
jgi:hypothetical protein